MTSMLLVLLTLTFPVDPAPLSVADPFEPLAFLVGAFEGTGESQMGPYKESFTGVKEVGGTVITVRSESRAGAMTVFRDLRVFSYDALKKELRLRQFAFGGVATYDIEVKNKGKSVVMTEVSFEGGRRAPWRYVFSDIGKEGFSYRVETRRGENWSPYVSARLKRKS